MVNYEGLYYNIEEKVSCQGGNFMNKLKLLLVTILCLAVQLVCGCADKKENIIPKGTCKVDYVTTSTKMERITFSGGFLRSSATPSDDNIVANALKGSKGIIYGKRTINNVEWAKVTTREGVTGWYCLEPGEDANEKAKNKEALDVNTKNYIVTYPTISGIDQEAASKINQEISKYMEVFRYISGPVGNNLRCLVTYNQNNILSILFESPLVQNRIFRASEVNDSASWSNLRNYCFVSYLVSDAIPNVLYAQKVDMQCGMVFDLKTGKRLNYKDLLKSGVNTDLAPMLTQYGEGSYVQNNNFFLTNTGNLDIFVDAQGSDAERKVLEIEKNKVKDLGGIK